MTHEQREEYVKQAKREFHNHPDIQGNSETYKTKKYSDGQEENKGRLFGYWKVRFLVAVLLFMGIFSLKQSNDSNSLVTQEELAAWIESDMNLQTVQAWFEEK